MPSRNEYPGYVKLPKKKLYNARIRLDFNARLMMEQKSARWEGFSLRLFTIDANLRHEHPEISVDLRPEEWLDLIEAMKREYRDHERQRREWEKRFGKDEE